MPKEPSWNIDVKSLSDRRLVEIALELDGSEHKELVESLRRELVGAAEGRGCRGSGLSLYTIFQIHLFPGTGWT
jgi:hypothetical protein